jgi:hypothetical protein
MTPKLEEETFFDGGQLFEITLDNFEIKKEKYR